MRAGQLFVFMGPVLLALVSLARWAGGAMSTVSVIGVLVASLLALLFAASGVSRANRR